jgi:dolichol kinase
VSELLVHAGVSAETTRRVAHLVGAGTAATFPLYLQLRDVLVLAGTCTLFLTYTWMRGSLRSIHAVLRPSIGAPLFPLGLGLAALAAWGRPAAIAFAALVLAIADPAAAVAGKRSASTGWRVIGGRKSLSGSLMVFLVSGALATTFSVAAQEPHLLGVLAVATLLTIIEGSLGYGLDNLALPLAAALLGETLLGL